VIDDALFVTGMQRSGTTLLERLLASQENLSILSQPFPLLFVETGRAWLRSRGFENARHPLGRLSDSASLSEFLRRWRPSHSEMAGLFARMADYSGQYTRFSPERLDRAVAQLSMADDDFAMVVRKLDRLLAANESARWVGSKESFCYEFVPPLLEEGFRCAIIIRDPRDVMASLNHGRGREFGGEIKPTLFNIRNWRKSVGVALSIARGQRFHWCRYEDLVANPVSSLSALATALEIDIDAERADLGNWSGNSSFATHRGVSNGSVGIHRSVLPRAVSAYIEATCLPELRLLGYETKMTAVQAIEAIENFREPYATRSGMEADAATPQNAAIERARLSKAMAS